eukprot:TRINITY_DN47052_c0_g1_i1.p1 TRINITY_DN47052_c0_g1~~TRINITY_DN47052_c0_g1_i1.p1  ORF type:complete len:523 (+),score=120.39 TRINITY_DN47052_c0_g1_i1:97-1569(+)
MSGLQIFVRSAQGETVAVEVNPDATVGDLRKAAADALKMNWRVCSISHSGAELMQDTATLADLGLGQESVVEASYGGMVELNSLPEGDRQRCNELLGHIISHHWGRATALAKELGPKVAFTYKFEELSLPSSVRSYQADRIKNTDTSLHAAVLMAMQSWALGGTDAAASVTEMLKVMCSSRQMLIHADGTGATPLHYAVDPGGHMIDQAYHSTLKVLLDAGADPCVQHPEGKRPPPATAGFAVEKPLVQQQYHYGQERCRLPRLAVFDIGRRAGRTLLQSWGPDAVTPLHAVCFHRQLHVAKNLLRVLHKAQGGSLRAEACAIRDGRGRYPLHCLILGKGGQTSQRDVASLATCLAVPEAVQAEVVDGTTSKTALQMAVELDLKLVARLLVQRGADTVRAKQPEVAKICLWKGLAVAVSGRPGGLDPKGVIDSTHAKKRGGKTCWRVRYSDGSTYDVPRDQIHVSEGPAAAAARAPARAGYAGAAPKKSG